jgi:phosphopantothenoylcysteine synthetase/decarboxylase
VQKLHTQIHQGALVLLAKMYKMICEEVKKPANRYEAASTLLGSERPFGQVHLLWQIFGLEDKEENDDSGDEDVEEGEDDESEDEDDDDSDEQGEGESEDGSEES